MRRLISYEEMSKVYSRRDWCKSQSALDDWWVGEGEKRVNDRSIELNSFLSFTHSFSHSPTPPGKSSPELTELLWSYDEYDGDPVYAHTDRTTFDHRYDHR